MGRLQREGIVPDSHLNKLKVRLEWAPSCDLEGEQEMELFVQLATRLDDGEAACFAIARSRGWLLATDDRLATKLAARAGLSVITTPELVRRWAVIARVTDEQAGVAIRNIQTFARFVPRRDSPECA